MTYDISSTFSASGTSRVYYGGNVYRVSRTSTILECYLVHTHLYSVMPPSPPNLVFLPLAAACAKYCTPPLYASSLRTASRHPYTQLLHTIDTCCISTIPSLQYRALLQLQPLLQVCCRTTARPFRVSTPKQSHTRLVDGYLGQLDHKIVSYS